jgi:hypothetical protein
MSQANIYCNINWDPVFKAIIECSPVQAFEIREAYMVLEEPYIVSNRVGSDPPRVRSSQMHS